MSLPQQNYLVSDAPRAGWAMVSEPYSLSAVIGRELLRISFLENGSVIFDNSAVHSNANYFGANLTDIPMENIRTEEIPAYASVNFAIPSRETSGHLCSDFFVRSQTLFLDRGGVEGFDSFFF